MAGRPRYDKPPSERTSAAASPALAPGEDLAEVTGRQQAESDLATANTLLHLALEAGNSVGWEWDVKSGRDSWFGDLQTMFGIPSTIYSGHVEDFRRRVHPEDRGLVWKAVKEAMDKRSPYIAEFRIVRPDGSVRWAAAQGRFYYLPSGEPDRMLGIAVDVTDRKAAEEALRRKDIELRESEERLRLAAQSGRMYAFEWDRASDVIVRSAEYAHILGMSGECKETTCRQMMTTVHPDDQARVTAASLSCTPENPRYRVQYRVNRDDGSIVWLEKNGHAFFDRDGNMQRVIGMVADITDRKLAEEALSTLSRRLIEAQEAERARIARDLHDDIGQRLTLILLTLERFRQTTSSAPQKLDLLNNLCKQVADTSRSVQNLSHELHSATLRHLGVAEAMRGFCRELSEQQKVEINFSDKDIPETVTPELSLCFFRVLQEALHNAVKHSGARRFDVDLRGLQGRLGLRVRDAGVGFDPEEAMKGRGLGLISMQERLKLVNGELAVESKPRRGTTIYAYAPAL